jgi:DNA-binding HxlR family transcriptional regulator
VDRKYLDPKVYRAIRSPRYSSILEKLADEPLTRNFKKKDLERRLNDNERKVLHNFLRRLRQLGVIEADTEQERGTYRFVNDLYRVYIHLVSQRTKKT